MCCPLELEVLEGLMYNVPLACKAPLIIKLLICSNINVLVVLFALYLYFIDLCGFGLTYMVLNDQISDTLR